VRGSSVLNPENYLQDGYTGVRYGRYVGEAVWHRGGLPGSIFEGGRGLLGQSKAIVDSVVSVGAWQPDMPAKNKK